MKNVTAIAALNALGQESRLNIYRLIVQRSKAGITPSEIVELLGIPAATTSFHLKELLKTKLIRCKKSGRSLIYSVEPMQIQALVSFLMENCCGRADCGDKTYTHTLSRQKSCSK